MSDSASESLSEGMSTPRPEEYLKIELEIEREKIALERERLAHERDKLSLERLKLQADSEFYTSRRRYVVAAPLTLALAAFFLLLGLGIGAILLKNAGVQVGGSKLQAPIHLKADIDGIEREGTAYLLFVK